MAHRALHARQPWFGGLILIFLGLTIVYGALIAFVHPRWNRDRKLIIKGSPHSGYGSPAGPAERHELEQRVTQGAILLLLISGIVTLASRFGLAGLDAFEVCALPVSTSGVRLPLHIYVSAHADRHAHSGRDGDRRPKANRDLLRGLVREKTSVGTASVCFGNEDDARPVALVIQQAREATGVSYGAEAWFEHGEKRAVAL